MGKIGASVSREQKERRVKFARLKEKNKTKKREHVEGDGARPRGAAHKICLHSPEKKSDEEGSRRAESESERERERESGEERRKTKVGPKTVVRFEDRGDGERRASSRGERKFPSKEEEEKEEEEEKKERRSTKEGKSETRPREERTVFLGEEKRE